MAVVMTEMIDVTVDLGDRTYVVAVGSGAVTRTASLLPSGVRRVAIVTQEAIPHSCMPDLGGLITSHHVIGSGESFKSLTTIERLCSEFAQAGLTRGDVIVGVGGGMVTDVAGFAASTYHRGIPVVHVATSLLAMIDASIGGKTGVNLAEGKNLVGAFWQPHAVVCDTDALASLPEHEMRCGLGEMAKYHFISHENLSELPLVQRIARCVQIKADIVASDERENGQRALLNYGHTLAHALEIATNFEIAHGEAVSVGLLYAAHLAHRMGRISDARVNEHYAVVHGLYDLKRALPKGTTSEQLIIDMGRDKKAIESLTFVLDSQNGLEVVTGISHDHIRLALEDLSLRLQGI